MGINGSMDVVEALDNIADAIRYHADKFYDVMTTSKVGDALDGLASISEGITFYETLPIPKEDPGSRP